MTNGELMKQVAANAIVQIPSFELTQAVIDALNKASKAELEEIESDVWKAREVGEEFSGVYLGDSASTFETDSGIVSWHHFACIAKNGEPMVKRLLGSAILSRHCTKERIGTFFKFRYDGETKTSSGQPLNLYTVFQIKSNGKKK